SVVIAVIAATAALWAAVSIRGFLPSLGASLIMGLAVSGMHYTGMAAVSVQIHPHAAHGATGQSPTSLLLPMLIGPVVFLLIAAVIVMFDPVLILGDGDWNKNTSTGRPRHDGSARRAAQPDLFAPDPSGRRPAQQHASGPHPHEPTGPRSDRH
ncbi:MHYT domain-containing protein, partial [Streptomyces sp. NPDC059766]|uniref:MHYT domain-containing protein n=1 Tax=Streptomyces sp. NPDC059766 TaxID=3346940 RepID=UPI0036613431